MANSWVDGVGQIVCLAGVIALAACSRTGPPSTRVAPVSPPDPCALALAPHAGDDEITRLQQRAAKAVDPFDSLEKLGWAYIVKARTSFDPGFYKLAEQTALCLESKQPGSPEAMLLRGHVLHNLHKFKDGEAVARALVAKRGTWSDYALLGDVLMEQGQLAAAGDAYQTMMDQRPGPQAYSRAAHLRWLKGDLPGAIEMMRMAASVTSRRDGEAAAWWHTRLALYELQAGDFDAATASADEALQIQPDYAPALLARGRILLGQDRAGDAVEPLQHAAQLNPLPEYEWVLLEACRATGRDDPATAAETWLRQHGAAEDPRTFALYLATTGRDAPTAVRLATDELNSRTDVFTLDALAWAWHAAGKEAEAQAMMARALAEGTHDARLFLHAAVITGQPEFLTKAAALQQMLLPSERKLLAAQPESQPPPDSLSNKPTTKQRSRDESTP